MNQTSTVDNDLQKAINDITNTTNNDPVFADPVAAPSSVPEGDTGELAESVGPFPAPRKAPTPPNPAMSIPPIDPTTTEPSSTSDFTIPPIQTATIDPTTTQANDTPTLNIQEVKIAALRDLAPLISKMNIPAAQKFNIYRDIFEGLRDYTVVEPAYQAAKEIQDERERAEALLYLVESIDNM